MELFEKNICHITNTLFYSVKCLELLLRWVETPISVAAVHLCGKTLPINSKEATLHFDVDSWGCPEDDPVGGKGGR